MTHTHTQTHLGRRLTMVTQGAFQTSRGRSVPTLSPDTPSSVIQAEKLAGPFLDTPRSLIQAARLEALLTLLDQLFEHPKMTFSKNKNTPTLVIQVAKLEFFPTLLDQLLGHPKMTFSKTLLGQLSRQPNRHFSRYSLISYPDSQNSETFRHYSTGLDGLSV